METALKITCILIVIVMSLPIALAAEDSTFVNFFNTSPELPTMIVLSIATFLILQAYEADKKRNRPYLAIIILTWVIIFLTMVGPGKTMNVPEINSSSEWVNDMKSYTVDVDPMFLADESYYSIGDPLIEETSKELIAEADNAVEYTEDVLSFVYKNIRYDWDEDDTSCLQKKASEIILKGTGQCDTQSMVVVSLLRSAGIPSRIVGGCIVRNPTCGSLMGFIEVERQPIFTEITEVEPNQIYSRKYSRTGGLHAFPQAMLPVGDHLEWFTLEATSGKFADTNCYSYFPEIENVSQKKEICISENYNYARACGGDDRSFLERYGGPYVQ